MDYDAVASALLVQVVQTVTKGNQTKESDGSWARRRIERLERRVDELERELSVGQSRIEDVGAERDQLELQLEHSEGNLALLTERLPTQSLVTDSYRICFTVTNGRSCTSFKQCARQRPERAS